VRKTHGFSLLEVIIGTAILSIVVVASFSTTQMAVLAASQALRRAASVSTGHDLLDDVEAIIASASASTLYSTTIAKTGIPTETEVESVPTKTNAGSMTMGEMDPGGNGDPLDDGVLTKMVTGDSTDHLFFFKRELDGRLPVAELPQSLWSQPSAKPGTYDLMYSDGKTTQVIQNGVVGAKFYLEKDRLLQVYVSIAEKINHDGSFETQVYHRSILMRVR
jgi:prepilin-type N-terminal cleavage/methylation domain-containing protein